MDTAAVKLIDGAGGAVALCARINEVMPEPVNLATVRKWRETGIPSRWAVICSELTGVPLVEFRPDMLPPVDPSA